MSTDIFDVATEETELGNDEGSTKERRQSEYSLQKLCNSKITLWFSDSRSTLGDEQRITSGSVVGAGNGEPIRTKTVQTLGSETELNRALARQG